MSGAAWVYIAGPYSACPTRCSAFAMDVWEELRTRGVRAICPHWSMQQDTRRHLAWDEWIAFDLELMERVRPDLVLRLPGPSPGADREVAHARSLGIEVCAIEHGRATPVLCAQVAVDWLLRERAGFARAGRPGEAGGTPAPLTEEGRR